MSTTIPTQPTIMLFDSGVGGLTVLSALFERCPHTQYYYVADQAHVPYGDRPLEEIRGFAEGLTAHAFEQHVDHVVMACNVSSAMYEADAQATYGAQRVLGMVRPGAQAAASATQSGRIGILATHGTVNSEAYPKALHQLGRRWSLQVACPSFVPLIEAGQLTGPEAEQAVQQALEPLLRQGVDTVILGCTHYPLLTPLIQRFAPELQVVDPAQAVAEYLGPRLSVFDPPHPSMKVRFRLATTGAVDLFRQQVAQLYPWVLPQAETIHVPAERTSLRLR